MEEQVALAGEARGEDEDLAHHGGEAGVVEFDHGAIEFEVPGQGSQLVAVDARDDGQEEVGAALGEELLEVVGHARGGLGARQVAADLGDEGGGVGIAEPGAVAQGAQDVERVVDAGASWRRRPRRRRAS